MTAKLKFVKQKNIFWFCLANYGDSIFFFFIPIEKSIFVKQDRENGIGIQNQNCLSMEQYG